MEHKTSNGLPSEVNDNLPVSSVLFQILTWESAEAVAIYVDDWGLLSWLPRAGMVSADTELIGPVCPFSVDIAVY